ncbi:MAG: Ig-like domain-containing protein, partial [Cocleimonas sp.]
IVTATTPSGSACTTTVQADGTYSCTLSPDPVDGEEVTVIVTDPSGNPSIPVTTTGGIDTTPPTTPTVNEPMGNPITGTGEPGGIVTATTPSGSACTTTVQADGTYSCTLSPDPVDGEKVTVIVTDPSGNPSIPVTTTGGIDTTAPNTPTLDNPPVNGGPITGTGEPGATVTVTTPSGSCTAIVQTDGTYSCDLSPTYVVGDIITVTQKDLAGNPSPPTTGIDTDNDGLPNYVDDDDDGDGNLDADENIAPNGDGNGDGIKDSLQQDVGTRPNPETGSYTTLAATGGCNIVDEYDVLGEPSLSTQDALFSYPVGLNDFKLLCANAGDSATVKFYYDKEYDTSTWNFRKFDTNGAVYADITTGVVYATEDVNGTTVTTATYTLTDGGVKDSDGLINSEIIDPAGPAINAANDDDDNDGLTNLEEVGGDINNPVDIDTDGDGVPDFLEPNFSDLDGDGVFNVDDTDDDGDGILTASENNIDMDNDGIPDYLDPDTTTTTGDGSGDSDNDGLSDKQECASFPCGDTDGDGVPDYMDNDSDNDGIDDQAEIGTDPANPTDSDNDGMPDYLESNIVDTDQNGVFNHLDDDDDGDGAPTSTEIGSDYTNPIDTDGNGIVDYLDDGLGGKAPVVVQTGIKGGSAPLWLLPLTGLLALRRRLAKKK